MGTDSNEHNEVEIDKIATEYTALRAEILKRIELRQQFIAMTLTIAGVFLGVGVTTDTIALVYPLLSTFLAISWAQNDSNIRRLAVYIRGHLENKTPYLGWETHIQRARKETRMSGWHLVILSHGGIFVFTQVIAIGIGLLRFAFTPVEWVLLGVDLIALLSVIWVVRQVR